MVYLDILLKNSFCYFSRTATRVPSSGPRSPERTPAASAAETEAPAASVQGKKTDVSFSPPKNFFVQRPIDLLTSHYTGIFSFFFSASVVECGECRKATDPSLKDCNGDCRALSTEAEDGQCVAATPTAAAGEEPPATETEPECFGQTDS